ncbi:alpha-amylase family glycosyl hydrolase [Synoicihabitans lomoniglobus]|uniref:Alpha-amylase family glycosyl hydrolase n=1 Tax=Synoicihabitans lomoniglobus TaxID=2909285 RepID=A0AAF0I419_9BACT|nr:alpha-glucosidase C-terminal domain-containing protein [Opitutaceae bacterium LMO-M01]WED66598.1 alpha-amylase family glycosyl hydrolase [Opitutaceae bacterium LMO-M01]
MPLAHPIPSRRFFIRLLAVFVLGTTGSLRAAETVNEPMQVCAGQPAVGVPDWIRDEVIYEVNVRQYSADGSFAAVEADLERIRDLGVGVIWFMPVHPIGAVNRKGPLGSYYSISDYRGINPEFGTLEDFKRLVAKAHAMGLEVVMDWVANHTAWDHPWTRDHPEFYARNEAGAFVPPYGFDWTDVIQLDFQNQDLWTAMIADMRYWIDEVGVDGFRCDYAKGLPTAFWDEAARQLRAVKPELFMLSEAETPQHQLAAFNASYGFDMMHAINEVAAGHHGASRIDDDLARTAVRFPTGGSMLYYTSNHDENSWLGTVQERLGGGIEVFAVLTFALDGIPLIYNGQEAGMAKRLEFFERDPIDWQPHALADFYRTLCALRTDHPAWHTGSRFERLPTTENASVYAVLREHDGDRVLALLNLTGEPVTFDTAHTGIGGTWTDAFTGRTMMIEPAASFSLPAWGYMVLTCDENE